jgi:cell shape-determining protein MreD
MKQRELSKFGKWFLNFMNNKGGVQGCVSIGLASLAFFIGPYLIQTFNLITSDMNMASKAIVIFGFVCVAVAFVFLIKMLIFVSKNTNLFK